MVIADIEKIFKAEFGFISDKFTVIEESFSNLGSSEKEHIFHPGVYVIVSEGKVVKVGRHLINSRKRALEHIRDNTSNEVYEMKSLAGNSEAKVLLINLKDPNNYHWAASVEMYLEKKLNPVIKSKRQG